MRLKKRYLCTVLTLAFTQQASGSGERHADRMVQSGIINDDHRSRIPS